jgi:mono/diheme cytochrome c family protein
MRWMLVGLGGLLLAGAASAGAQETGDAREGRVLVDKLCRSCHLVAPDQRGPVPDGVPSFMAIAGRPGLDAKSIEARLVRPPHPMMPDPPLDQRQMRDVAAYILSLRP